MRCSQMDKKYTAITFAPVQGFIEKSRKLRDLYGASIILSYLSQQLVKAAEDQHHLKVISPAIANIQKGMPNRILIKGDFSQKDAEQVILSRWKNILKVCRLWIEEKVPNTYHWEREWSLWGSHTWEIFWGSGDNIEDAMKDLETNKLSRDWTAINWVGESSSLTGTDAIAFPRLGAKDINPNDKWTSEKGNIDKFYTALSQAIENPQDNPQDEEDVGKFLAVNEKLSIPELVKRLITLPEVARRIGIDPLKSFTEIYRLPEKKNTPGSGRWTGWFMGDGDRVGKHLKKLAEEKNGDEKIYSFSQAMQNWGKDFSKDFPPELGRIVYAGGDDFLGVIFSRKSKDAVKPKEAYSWLLELPEIWKRHNQKIGVSVGFVWAGHSIPQRDILQHCREAEKVAKSLGRDRITIRVVFNSGQYVEWTCPWDYLYILNKYRDREQQSNWSHIYQDIAHLGDRRAFDITHQSSYIAKKAAIEFFHIYFPREPEKDKSLFDHKFIKHLVGFSEDDDEKERDRQIIDWITNLIKVGWHLCSNT